MDSPASETVEVQATGSATQSQNETPQREEVADVADQNSPTPNDEGTEQPLKPTTGPMQKRRRVTRACDECRRKKIKCDGKQPCTHCTVYSYGQPHHPINTTPYPTDIVKNAHTISRRTVDEMQHLSISRRWKHS